MLKQGYAENDLGELEMKRWKQKTNRREQTYVIKEANVLTQHTAKK
jgi:hypothetical protein